MDIANDLYETLRRLLPSTDSVMVELDEEIGMWGVWLDGDLIGGGQARSEALAAAVATIRNWESNK